MTRPIQPVRRAAWLVVFLFCCLLVPGIALADTGTGPVITNSPPAATVNTSYWFTFDTGGDPATFTQLSGALPTGLTLYSNGVITGFPTEIGPGSEVTVRATNAVGDTDVTVTIDVVAQPPAFTNTPPTTATVGTAYYGRFYLRGTPTPTTSVSGDLPPGVEFFPDYSELIGTPTTAGTYTFTVTATNGAEPDATATLTVTVAPAAVQPSITGTPPSGVVGQPYSFAFTVVGDLTLSADPAFLPAGLTLSPSGVLSGVPTQAGSSSFVVTGTGPGGTVTWWARIDVAGPPAVSVTDAAVREGDRGDLTPMTFRVSLSRPVAGPVTVRWSTRPGTACSGQDYVAASGTVTFAPGQTEATVTVQVRGDRLRERTETFGVQLARPVGAVLGDKLGVGRIYDND